MAMQRIVPLLFVFLGVFGMGFTIGMQVSPLQAAVAWGFGGAAVLPVLMAYVAAARTP
jgi:hypothetical protein